MKNYNFECTDCDAVGYLEVDVDYAGPTVCPVCGSDTLFREVDEEDDE